MLKRFVLRPLVPFALWMLPVLGLGGCANLLPSRTSTPPTALATLPSAAHIHTMDLGPAGREYDLRFLDAMVPHHEGAVVMAEDALQKTQRAEVRQLAQAIVRAQAEEIAQMKRWRAAWYPQAPANLVAWHGATGHSMPMSDEQIQAMRMDEDLGPADATYDPRFLDGMILHHEAAVVMAKDVLQKSQRPEVRQLAQAILASQTAEVNQMKAWRQQWYGQ
ncbi:MAG: DUF305 domain-containing protein [Gloeomargaritaceae cyanobacterium C42_A2020_066]|nr:DUF305 domain-containing protein [Gloeomargaritaceae cyanobacterium C42_A2020_066]